MISNMKVQETCTTPVVALHSSASNPSQWDNLINEFGDRHNFITLDLPGYGSDLKRDTTRADMGALALPIIDKVAALGEPFHLVGHSCGGGVALKIALIRPDLVRSLTLYEPSAFNILETSRHSDRLLLRDLDLVEEALKRSIHQGSPHQGMRVFVDFWNGEGAWDRMSKGAHQTLASLAPTVAQDFGHMFAENWITNDLTGLSMPVLLMMGMDSPSVAQRTTALLVELLANAELAMLPGLGHMAPISAPHWVNPRIAQHIARVERSASSFSWPQDVAA